MIQNRTLTQHEKVMIEYMVRDGVSHYRISRVMGISAGDVAEHAKSNRHRDRVDSDLVGKMVDVEGMTFEQVSQMLGEEYLRIQNVYWQYVGRKRERERNHKCSVARGFAGWR